MRGKARNLALLVTAQVLCLAVWFAGTAVLPALLAEGATDRVRGGLLTTAVQLGFVAGTLASAVLALADRIPGRRLFFGCGVVAGCATMAMAAVPPAGPLALALRVLAGAAIAGVYPIGMKLAAGWARGDLGLMIGLLVAAVTLGSASPHLLPALLPGLPWRSLYIGAGLLALLGAGLILLFREGPAPPRRARPSASTMRCMPGGTGGCASPMPGISATCGSSTPCGPGCRCSCTSGSWASLRGWPPSP